MQEAAYAQRAVQQLQALRQQYWQRLYLATLELSDDDLRAALHSTKSDQRFAAAYVVGERLLDWHNDLIPLLEDKSDAVRQGTRRSLIILSFLTLNPEEARKIRSPQRNQPATPLAQLKQAADFGPQPLAKAAARAEAARQWQEWWAEHEPPASPSRSQFMTSAPAPPDENTESGRLAAALLRASPDRRSGMIATYQASKGVQYTEALALAIARQSGDEKRQKLREALNDRMARMSDKSLGQYLEDDDAEIRRAAALGLAMRESKAHFDRMISLLLDPQPIVERAVHAALRSLSGKDFGPKVNATEDEKNEAASRWRQWWQTQR